MAGLAVLPTSPLLVVNVDKLSWTPSSSERSSKTQSDLICEADFVHAWREELEDVDRSFTDRLAQILRLIFENMSDDDLCGDPFEQARAIGAQDAARAEEIRGHLKCLLDFANSNTTELREAVMNWDKIHHAKLFSSLRFELMSRSFHQNTLILRLIDCLTPQTTSAALASSPPTSSLASFDPSNTSCTTTTSSTLTLLPSDTTTTSTTKPPSSPPFGPEATTMMSGAAMSATIPSAWLPNLVSELVKLKSMIRGTSGDLLQHLVAHRGFHCTTDRIHRPIENTLQAMEQAWVHGLHYCECDITLTLDGQIVLAHDTTLHRLSLFPNSSTALVPIHTITFRDLIASPLKSGVRPALLRDVLESASRLGAPSQLVIELKHGTPNTPQALVRFFASNPSYLSNVAVVMSFDLEMIHDFAQRIQQLNWSLYANDEGKDSISWPKVMFLTCAPGRQEYPYEMEVGLDQPEVLKSLLERPNSKLDGAYMEFENSMLQAGSRGQDTLKQLCKQMTVGVWGVRPDNTLSAKVITDMGVRFVNTDLPSTFVQTSI